VTSLRARHDNPRGEPANARARWRRGVQAKSSGLLSALRLCSGPPGMLRVWKSVVALGGRQRSRIHERWPPVWALPRTAMSPTLPLAPTFRTQSQRAPATEPALQRQR
jgi:hypothetical protein